MSESKNLILINLVIFFLNVYLFIHFGGETCQRYLHISFNSPATRKHPSFFVPLSLAALIPRGGCGGGGWLRTWPSPSGFFLLGSLKAACRENVDNKSLNNILRSHLKKALMTGLPCAQMVGWAGLVMWLVHKPGLLLKITTIPMFSRPHLQAAKEGGRRVLAFHLPASDRPFLWDFTSAGWRPEC